MATPNGFNPTGYSDASGTAFTEGAIYTYLGVGYRYVKNSTDGSTALGQCAVRASATAWLVTYSKGASALNSSKHGVGFWVAVVPVSNWGFIQIDGVITGKDSSNGVTAGKRVTPNTTANGDVANVANAYDPGVGRALASGSGGLVAIEVVIS